MLLKGLPLLPTTIVGSYPQPDWLIDREGLKNRMPPRIRAEELWRIKPPLLADAQEAATLVAISDQTLAGAGISRDGATSREAPPNRLATAAAGNGGDNPDVSL